MKPCILFALALAALPVGRAADWRFGTMSLQWLDGFERTPSADAARFVGPNGEVVLVTAMGLREGGDAGKTAKHYLDFGEAELPKLSASKGKDVMQMRREELAEDITLFSTAAIPKRDKRMFYLQFLAVSKTGRSALITIEGLGEPTEQLKRFRPLLDTIKWTSNEKKG
jgi:hypothetical protein